MFNLSGTQCTYDRTPPLSPLRESFTRGQRESEDRMTQIALAWVLAQGDDIVPIPGTKRRQYVEENVKALDLRLSSEDVKQPAAAVPPEEVAGQRYPAG
jgi:aryl-alcohol dehydrogenase-like predicted oxidoreductase